VVSLLESAQIELLDHPMQEKAAVVWAQHIMNDGRRQVILFGKKSGLAPGGGGGRGTGSHSAPIPPCGTMG
jgi:hypothetical protein